MQLIFYDFVLIDIVFYLFRLTNCPCILSTTCECAMFKALQNKLLV